MRKYNDFNYILTQQSLITLEFEHGLNNVMTDILNIC